MSGRRQDKPVSDEPEARVDDLDVPESESEDVKGGYDPVYQKVKWDLSTSKSPGPKAGTRLIQIDGR
jgi:hypothetical protein